MLYTALRRLLSLCVGDLTESTLERLRAAAPEDVHAVRHLPPLVGFSAPMAAELRTLKQFLFARLYRHPQVETQRQLAQQVLRELFAIYLAQGVPEPRDSDPARSCADYLAGMTDRFAIREHHRLTGLRLFDLG